MGQARKYSKPHPCSLPFLTPELIETKAGRIEAAIFGNPAGHALIFLPHGLGDWSSLAPVALELALQRPDLRFVSLSRPGCGETQRVPEGVSDPLGLEASTILPALMDALGIEAAHLVGHADGASVALAFAGMLPDRALSVVGLAAYGFADDYLRASLEPMVARADGPHLLSSLSSSGDPDSRFLRWREDRLWECETRWNATRFLGGIIVPVTLVQGARDEFISLDQSAAISARITGDICWITLQNAGHFVYLDNPQQIIMLIQRQLDQAGSVVPPTNATEAAICIPTSSPATSDAVRSRGRTARSPVVAEAAPACLFPA